MILVARSTADANCSDDLSILLQGNAAGENHDLPVVGSVNTEELSTRL
jgi:hypothetical protein